MLAQDIRRIVLQRAYHARVGHIGSALCIADIVAALYGQVLRVLDPDDGDRDRVILSMGHAALALYAALFLKGWLTEAALASYCADGSLLATHPEREIRGVDFCSGSLGQGLSMGAGAALAARMQRSSRRVFVIVSDGECNEGSLWEAVMFAAHHRLSNLVAIVVDNGQQAFGRTRDVLNLSPLDQRWRSFGWEVREIDGHDAGLVASTLAALDTTSGPPHAIVARTVAGKGVSFMEGQIKWHYWPMSDDEYARALQDLERGAR